VRHSIAPQTQHQQRFAGAVQRTRHGGGAVWRTGIGCCKHMPSCLRAVSPSGPSSGEGGGAGLREPRSALLPSRFMRPLLGVTAAAAAAAEGPAGSLSLPVVRGLRPSGVAANSSGLPVASDASSSARRSQLTAAAGNGPGSTSAPTPLPGCCGREQCQESQLASRLEVQLWETRATPHVRVTGTSSLPVPPPPNPPVAYACASAAAAPL
jgi:hypothetical protein